MGESAKKPFWNSKRFWMAVVAAGGAIPVIAAAVSTGNVVAIIGAVVSAIGVVGQAYFGFKGGPALGVRDDQ